MRPRSGGETAASDRRRFAGTAALALASALALGAAPAPPAAAAAGGTTVVFGPQVYIRLVGKPFTVSERFTQAHPGPFTLHIDNGCLFDILPRVTSATVALNGASVLAPSDFGSKVATLDRPVTLLAHNQLDVQLRGEPLSCLTLKIVASQQTDTTPPTITATAAPAANGAGWNNANVTVTFQCADAGSGIATCPPAVTVSTEGAHQVVSGTAIDRAGNQATASVTLNLDKTAPAAAITSPAAGSFLATAGPAIAASFGDGLSGIDPASVHLTLDGADRTAQAQIGAGGLTLAASGLADGAHTVTVSLRDVAGNPAAAAAHFTTDTQAPSLTITAPGPLVNGNPTPTVAVAYGDTGSGIDLSSLHVLLGTADLTSGCTITGSSASCRPAALAAGSYEVLSYVRDRAGNLTTATLLFQLAFDVTPPALTITSPAGPLVIGNATPTLAIAYSDPSGIDLASPRLTLDGSAVAGCTVGAAATTCPSPALARGPHTLAAQVRDLRGNLATASLGFAATFPLDIAFTTPAPETVLTTPLVRIAGTVSPSARSVAVNGIPAVLAGGTFSLDALGLHDGVNNLVAVATDAFGNVGTATVWVVADTTPPQISIASPADGSTASDAAVTVSGLVNDLRIGTVGEAEVTVTVNGVAATVVNRSFLAAGVPLSAGANVLTATATDRAGNQASAIVHVSRQSPAGASIQKVGGDGQTAVISTPLPAPLQVKVTGAAGQPAANAQVVFRVVQGDGLLAGSDRVRVVRTDGTGTASIPFTLGDRAGAGVDRVRATAVGVTGEAVFSAISQTAPPAAVNVASGGGQRGAVGTELSQPLFAVVTDAGNNPIPGVPVTFRVVAGGGSFAGAPTAVAATDASGLATARLTLGGTPGLDDNIVQADFPGLAHEIAVFQASAFLPGDPAATAIVGAVLDNQGDPVPGVTLRLRNSPLTAATDAQGQFRLSGVPVGQVFLLVDASTTTRPGSWASLEFELFAVPGIDNTLPRPIYILPLDLAGGIFVDETHGGTLTIPGLPGFSLNVVPGSVTFPGGGRNGVVSVTAVHPDRIPMAPGAGMQPRLIVTIQPVGARFNPPARVSFPNVDSLPAGKVTELFSFDHDIGAFVSIGTGTVSEDGLMVQSDPGFGIVQAGWHCGTPPSANGSGGSLSVKLTPDPIKIQYGKTTDVTATGKPPRDGEYIDWKVTDSELDDTLDFQSQPSCGDADSCVDTLESKEAEIHEADRKSYKVCGKAKANVTFRCKTTGATVSDKVSIEQGCGGKSADECTNFCTSQPALGMCGTACDLIGASHPAFNPNIGHSCWRINVSGTWYCYWDVNVANGTGFQNLCCPNRCYGISFTVWGQGSGAYICTVIEQCASNPAFGGPDAQGDPGRSCQKPSGPGD
ncbi:MAG TPA: Ig-like domain-containing protein [Thermoanaerobaculia bacterium]|nr:Ig-like domain-containing protein [Thermoanaerobaculia bacterium]